MTLVKKLTKIGNSWGIILPTEILHLSGVEPEGECEIDVGNHEIRLRPHRKMNLIDKRVEQAMGRFVKKYHKDLKKLA